MREWVYQTHLGKWICRKTNAIGFPKTGDYYLDWNEWRIW